MLVVELVNFVQGFISGVGIARRKAKCKQVQKVIAFFFHRLFLPFDLNVIELTFCKFSVTNTKGLHQQIERPHFFHQRITF